MRVMTNERGFTLVEVLIAMVIMTVGLVAVAQLMAVSMQTHRLGRVTAEASQLATGKLEELTKLNLTTNPAVQITPVAPDPLANNVANFFDVSGNFIRRWQVSAGPTADTRRVTVRVIRQNAAQPFTKDVEVTSILRQW